MLSVAHEFQSRSFSVPFPINLSVVPDGATSFLFTQLTRLRPTALCLHAAASR